MNLSSAKDLVLLTHHAARNALFRKIMGKEIYRYECAEVIQDNPEHHQSIRELTKPTHKERKEYIKRSKRIWQNTNTLLRKGW
jgi:D-alanyl-D-alanine carboxypeptidase